MIELWHNPACSKSRATLALLEERSEEVRIVRYLDTPPSRERLAAVAALLAGGAKALLRSGEAPPDLAAADDAGILDALAATPTLIQRPVVITELGARIGRPPEAVLEVLPT